MDELMDLLPDSVSSGDAYSVSSGDNINVYYQIDIHTVSEPDVDPQYTLFDKPLSDYTVSEGLLLILVVLLVCKVVWFVIKEGFKWLNW